jgi:hypothetical protein
LGCSGVPGPAGGGASLPCPQPATGPGPAVVDGPADTWGPRMPALGTWGDAAWAPSPSPAPPARLGAPEGPPRVRRATSSTLTATRRSSSSTVGSTGALRLRARVASAGVIRVEPSRTPMASMRPTSARCTTRIAPWGARGTMHKHSTTRRHTQPRAGTTTKQQRASAPHTFHCAPHTQVWNDGAQQQLGCPVGLRPHPLTWTSSRLCGYLAVTCGMPRMGTGVRSRVLREGSNPASIITLPRSTPSIEA